MADGRPTIGSQQGRISLSWAAPTKSARRLFYSPRRVDTRPGDLPITSRTYTASYSLNQHQYPRGGRITPHDPHRLTPSRTTNRTTALAGSMRGRPE